MRTFIVTLRITPSPSPKYLRKFSHLATYESAGPSSGAKIMQLVKKKPPVQQKMDSYFEDEIRASGGRVKYMSFLCSNREPLKRKQECLKSDNGIHRNVILLYVVHTPPFT